MKNTYKEVSCNCAICKNMCANSTCLPTPDEARKLIDAGYATRLATYKFYPLDDGPRFLGPAPLGKHMSEDLKDTQSRCTFYTDEGLCELHSLGLKPLEGRIAHHDRPWQPIRLVAMGSWKNKQFFSVYSKWLRHIKT